MKKFLLASVLTGALCFPAFAAMSPDMSCADFMAMDADAQMEALGQMAGGGMAADNMAADSMAADSMAADDMMAGDTAKAVAAVCADNPDMMVSDAMMKVGDH